MLRAAIGNMLLPQWITFPRQVIYELTKAFSKPMPAKMPYVADWA
jgi:hypothetical protein